MSQYSGFDEPTSSAGATENVNALIHPPAAGPAPIQDLASILLDPAQHFRLDLDQAPAGDRHLPAGRTGNAGSEAPGEAASQRHAARSRRGQYQRGEEIG